IPIFDQLGANIVDCRTGQPFPMPYSTDFPLTIEEIERQMEAQRRLEEASIQKSILQSKEGDKAAFSKEHEKQKEGEKEEHKKGQQESKKERHKRRVRTTKLKKVRREFLQLNDDILRQSTISFHIKSGESKYVNCIRPTDCVLMGCAICVGDSEYVDSTKEQPENSGAKSSKKKESKSKEKVNLDRLFATTADCPVLVSSPEILSERHRMFHQSMLNNTSLSVHSVRSAWSHASLKKELLLTEIFRKSELYEPPKNKTKLLRLGVELSFFAEAAVRVSIFPPHVMLNRTRFNFVMDALENSMAIPNHLPPKSFSIVGYPRHVRKTAAARKGAEVSIYIDGQPDNFTEVGELSSLATSGVLYHRTVIQTADWESYNVAVPLLIRSRLTPESLSLCLSFSYYFKMINASESNVLMTCVDKKSKPSFLKAFTRVMQPGQQEELTAFKCRYERTTPEPVIWLRIGDDLGIGCCSGVSMLKTGEHFIPKLGKGTDIERLIEEEVENKRKKHESKKDKASKDGEKPSDSLHIVDTNHSDIECIYESSTEDEETSIQGSHEEEKEEQHIIETIDEGSESKDLISSPNGTSSSSEDSYQLSPSLETQLRQAKEYWRIVISEQKDNVVQVVFGECKYEDLPFIIENNTDMVVQIWELSKTSLYLGSGKIVKQKGSFLVDSHSSSLFSLPNNMSECKWSIGPFHTKRKIRLNEPKIVEIDLKERKKKGTVYPATCVVVKVFFRGRKRVLSISDKASEDSQDVDIDLIPTKFHPMFLLTQGHISDLFGSIGLVLPMIRVRVFVGRSKLKELITISLVNLSVNLVTGVKAIGFEVKVGYVQVDNHDEFCQFSVPLQLMGYTTVKKESEGKRITAAELSGKSDPAFSLRIVKQIHLGTQGSDFNEGITPVEEFVISLPGVVISLDGNILHTILALAVEYSPVKNTRIDYRMNWIQNFQHGLLPGEKDSISQNELEERFMELMKGEMSHDDILACIIHKRHLNVEKLMKELSPPEFIMFIRLFALNAIHILVDLFPAASADDWGSILPRGMVPVITVLTSAIRLKDAMFRVPGMKLYNSYVCPSQLMDNIIVHFKKTILQQLLLAIGYVGILGNPAGLVRSIGTGMVDLLYEPWAYADSPWLCLKSFGRGMYSLVMNTLRAASSSVGGILTGFGGLFQSATSQSMQQKRKQRETADSSGAHAKASGQALAGIGEGWANIVKKPQRGGQKSVGAAFRGFGSGLKDALMGTLGGVFDSLGHLFMSMSTLGKGKRHRDMVGARQEVLEDGTVSIIYLEDEAEEEQGQENGGEEKEEDLNDDENDEKESFERDEAISDVDLTKEIDDETKEIEKEKEASGIGTVESND
ncbi:Vacuolar protein sorting-associated protein 13 like protein, partial [Aduncisulcus paluster]